MIGIYVLLIIAMLLVIKLCKKTLKIILSSIIILVAFYCVIISVDMTRVISLREPIFARPTIETDFSMKTKTYQGLGYKVEVVEDVTKKGPENRICQVEMYMFNKVIAASIK